MPFIRLYSIILRTACVQSFQAVLVSTYSVLGGHPENSVGYTPLSFSSPVSDQALLDSGTSGLRWEVCTCSSKYCMCLDSMGSSIILGEVITGLLSLFVDVLLFCVRMGAHPRYLISISRYQHEVPVFQFPTVLAPHQLALV